MIETSFTNKMGRTYKSYSITERLFNMLEVIYIYRGGDYSNKEKLSTSNKDVVYLFTDNSGSYKIGITNNLKTRLGTIQCGCNTYLEPILSFFGTKEDESYLHELFKDKRLSGEWFSINEIDIIKIVSYKKGGITFYKPLKDLLFEYWHTSKKETPEPDFNLVFSENTKKKMQSIKWRVLKAIKEGQDYESLYKEITSN
jgi:hypothetical protein